MLLRLGTRASALARVQSGQVAHALEARHPGLRVELVFIRTSGDRVQRGPVPPAGLKGLFVKEIEEALARGQVDLGVHSMKDLPAHLAPGLVVGAVPSRADPHVPGEDYASVGRVKPDFIAPRGIDQGQGVRLSLGLVLQRVRCDVDPVYTVCHTHS